MQFGDTEDRRMLSDMLRRFLAENYANDMRSKLAETQSGFSAEIWAGLAELGIIGALFSEEVGGFGGAGFDISTVFEELGRAGTVEPLLDTLYAGGLIADLGDEAQKELLAPVIAGEKQIAFAHGEPGSRYDLSHVETHAAQTAAGFTLTGAKSVVGNGAAADTIVVSARTSGEVRDANGISLFVVPVNAKGLSRKPYAKLDGGNAAEIALDGVEVPSSALLGPLGCAFDAIEFRAASAITAICAEALGAMEQAKDLTVEYLKTRQQFGRPIGKFQALQHRMVEILIDVEQARSAVINAADHLEGDRLTRERMVSAAKNLIGRTGRRISEECVQMHGGIGMTEEYALSHFARRLILIDHVLGDADHHLERFIALGKSA
ncbi:acyl-CoA dehydrogenase [Roseobacter cerasinus]|uniref:Acyl-CoA dehydrogenase n=1 Tax=Roseobacter cerasinus TaxID=2602289 RepID=A0A640W1S3_9RHOB|nr:acyl-CoA dehydrogenase [Roseobacter cerasinus]GFE52436.1 acyl-CoA dehydrogenase [Roseobacter cerasinus]